MEDEYKLMSFIKYMHLYYDVLNVMVMIELYELNKGKENVIT